jgi:hypothetical protein
MKTRHIIGELRTTNPRAFTHLTPQHLYKATEKHHLSRVITTLDSHQVGVLPIDTIYGNVLDEEINKTLNTDAQTISEALAKFIKEDGVQKLELQGEITITLNDTESSEVSVIKICVKYGQVTYQQGTFTWSDKTLISDNTKG